MSTELRDMSDRRSGVSTSASAAPASASAASSESDGDSRRSDRSELDECTVRSPMAVCGETDAETGTMPEAAAEQELKRKTDILGQLPLELEKGKGYFHGYDITVYKCKGKVVKYDAMAVAKCIISFPHTILVEGETWVLLNCLTVLCFLTMVVCLISGSASSMGVSDVTGRVQLLLGFVLGGHVGQVLSRWTQLRFTTFGPMFGNMENFCTLVHQVVLVENTVTAELKQRAKRYSRLMMQLLFLGIQDRDDTERLVSDGLLMHSEVEWLQACPANTRCLLVFGWLSKMWGNMKAAGLVSPTAFFLGDQTLISIKGGVVGTVGMVACPLPYAYVHVVYWTLQMLLSILAVETGTMLAIFIKRGGNGNEEYSFDDGTHEVRAV
jgi:hypothetical protein